MPLVGVLLDGLGQQFFGLVPVHDLAPAPGEDTLACFLKISGLPGGGPRWFPIKRLRRTALGRGSEWSAWSCPGSCPQRCVVVQGVDLDALVYRPVLDPAVPAGGAVPLGAGVSVWPPRGPGCSELVGVDRYESLADGVDGQEHGLKGDHTQQAGLGRSGEYHRGGEGPAPQADHGVSDVDAFAASVSEAGPCGTFHWYAHFPEHGSGEGGEGGWLLSSLESPTWREPSWSCSPVGSGRLPAPVSIYICARFVTRLNANHPSPVLNAWGFALCASLISPNPSSKGSKSTIRSYRTRNFFFAPEK